MPFARESRHTPAYRAFLERLRAAREEAGLRQADVARHLNRPQSFVSKTESGERLLDALEFCQLALLYDQPVSYFVEAEERGVRRSGRRKRKRLRESL